MAVKATLDVIIVCLRPIFYTCVLKNEDFGFIRIMSRWPLQGSALELSAEENRLGRGSNLGCLGGNLCLWGPERFSSGFRVAKYTYPLFG